MAESRLDSSDLSQDNDCSLTFGSDSRTPKNVFFPKTILFQFTNSLFFSKEDTRKR